MKRSHRQLVEHGLAIIYNRCSQLVEQKTRPSLGLLLGLVLALSLASCIQLARKSPTTNRSRVARAWSAHGNAGLMPARWQTNRHAEGEPRAARVHVYAGHKLRAQSPDWQRQFNAYLDLANQLLVPEFGVRLEVTAFTPWTRLAPDDDLAAALEELTEHDDGAEVAWVIGLVSAPSSTSTDIDALGIAPLLGRHLVLSGYGELPERRALGDPGGEPDEDFHLVHRLHKQAAVLLHELGHSLGAIHVTEPRGALLNAHYNKERARFSPSNAHVIAEVLNERLRDRKSDSRRREAHALRRALFSLPRWDGWGTEDYTQLSRLLAKIPGSAEPTDSVVPAARGPKTRAVPPASRAVPAAVRINAAHVNALAKKGRYAEAWRELEKLIYAYPSSAALQLSACSLWLQKEGPEQHAVRHCERVSELDPAYVAGAVALAKGYAKHERRTRAHSVLSAALTRSRTVANGRQQAFDEILSVYRDLGALTWTRAAMAMAPPDVDTEKTQKWVVTTLRRSSLPPSAVRHGITPEREGEYIAMVYEVFDKAYAREYTAARKVAQQGLRTFKNAPGFLAALCDLEYRARAYKAAYRHCANALRIHGGASWPRYLMGILELRKRRDKVGISHLMKAIDNDPDLKKAYRALYKAYARVKDSAARKKLRMIYYERFGTQL